jgi:archaellum component FlaG (FlaF/FlaG flagellin family)
LKISYSTSVGATFCGRPLRKRFLNSAIRLLSFLRPPAGRAGKQESMSFFKNHNWIPVFTGMTQSKFKGRSRRILGDSFLKNSKGISVLFLIIALLLMVTIGYVLSYLIPTKQKSVRFPIYSNQAFYIAQSGVEYAVRYSDEKGWKGTTDSGTYDLTHLNDSGVYQRNLGNGRFTINYNQGTNLLTSTGEITNGSEKRVVRVSNFTQFLRLVFDPASSAPYWSQGTREATFYIKNVRGNNVTLTAFSASWTQGTPTRDIHSIVMNGSEKYSGTYTSGDPKTSFNSGGSSQTITPNQVITVIIDWRNNIKNDANIIFTFYTSTGDGSNFGYTFNLDPEGNGL